jgi:hypothetical protein
VSIPGQKTLGGGRWRRRRDTNPLVVDMVRFNDQWFDGVGHTQTGKLPVIERYWHPELVPGEGAVKLAIKTERVDERCQLIWKPPDWTH